MTELGTRFQEAFQDLGEKIIERSPALLIGLVILIIFILVGRMVRRVLENRFLHKVEDRLLVSFIGRMVFIVFILIGIIIFLDQAGWGKVAGGLLAGAGVSAIILGFAFRDIGENFLSGFVLAFSRPFGIGDVVEVGGLIGKVRALSFRNTHIRTFEGKDIYLPNSMMIKNPVINYTRDGLLRHDFIIGLDYGSDIAKALRVIDENLDHVKEIEHSDGLRPVITIHEFATSTINLKIYFWINSFDYAGDQLVLKTRVMHSILLTIMDKGFSLPADIVELKMYQEGTPIPINITEKKTPEENQSSNKQPHDEN
jgi:small-conductance mechanosensitive channel